MMRWWLALAMVTAAPAHAFQDAPPANAGPVWFCGAFDGNYIRFFRSTSFPDDGRPQPELLRAWKRFLAATYNVRSPQSPFCAAQPTPEAGKAAAAQAQRTLVRPDMLLVEAEWAGEAVSAASLEATLGPGSGRREAEAARRAERERLLAERERVAAEQARIAAEQAKALAERQTKAAAASAALIERQREVAAAAAKMRADYEAAVAAAGKQSTEFARQNATYEAARREQQEALAACNAGDATRCAVVMTKEDKRP